VVKIILIIISSYMYMYIYNNIIIRINMHTFMMGYIALYGIRKSQVVLKYSQNVIKSSDRLPLIHHLNIYIELIPTKVVAKELLAVGDCFVCV